MAFVWRDRKSGTSYLDYTPPGGKRTRKRIGKSKQAAELAFKKTEYQLSFDRGGLNLPSLSLGAFLARYVETAKPSMRPSSWKRYRAILDHFRTYLGPKGEEIPLPDLSTEKLQRYVAWRRGGNGAFARNGRSSKPASVKAKTINTEIDRLRIEAGCPTDA